MRPYLSEKRFSILDMLRFARYLLNGASEHYIRGQFQQWWRGPENRPIPFEPYHLDEQPQPRKFNRIICPYCLKEVSVNKNGFIRPHNIKRSHKRCTAYLLKNP